MNKREKKACCKDGRRDFLRKSAFAVCTTPFIMSMIVQKASAAKSWNSGAGTITGTGSPPDNAPLGPNPGRGRNDRPKKRSFGLKSKKRKFGRNDRSKIGPKSKKRT